MIFSIYLNDYFSCTLVKLCIMMPWEELRNCPPLRNSLCTAATEHFVASSLVSVWGTNRLPRTTLKMGSRICKPAATECVKINTSCAFSTSSNLMKRLSGCNLSTSLRVSNFIAVQFCVFFLPPNVCLVLAFHPPVHFTLLSLFSKPFV